MTHKPTDPGQEPAVVANILDRIKRKPESKPKQEAPRRAAGDWRDALIVKVNNDGSDQVVCRVHNLILILQNAPMFKDRIKLNLFSEQVSIDGQDAKKVAVTKIKAEIERHWIPGEKVPTTDVAEALAAVAEHNQFNPVLDYLNGLKWDGTPRIDEFFSVFCGTKREDPYHVAVARALFISAVLRIIKPGCKVDLMVILEGVQGAGKTKLWSALFSPWYAEVVDSLNSKDFFIGLRGIWCADFGELDQFSKAETTRIKQVITSQTDNYRGLFETGHQRHPRQCIFVGGTNSDSWQTDSTGARRFLPVRVNSEIDAEGVTAVRDELFAEAMTWVANGTTGKWWSIPNAIEHQEASYVGDPWETPIHAMLAQIIKDAPLKFPPVEPETTTYDALFTCLNIDKGKQTRSDQMRVSAIFKRAGWERKQLTGGGWCYRPKKK